MGVIDLPLTTVACIMLFLGIIKYKKGLLLNKYIIALAFCFLLNFISCSYFNNQNMFTTFLASSDFYSLALFWLFYSWKWNLKKWENALWWLCLCFGICYIIQYIAYPTEIFGGQIRTESTERRMAIYGQGLASLSVIFGFNKYLLEKKNKKLNYYIKRDFCLFWLWISHYAISSNNQSYRISIATRCIKKNTFIIFSHIHNSIFLH